MLTLFGPKTRYCDGISRRGFLQVGALTFGAASLSLTDILRAEAQAGTSSRHKAVINIFLGGGPPHQDMWDIKTEAPPEIRGEFKPIATNVTGIQIGEVFPQIAARMDKCVVIRSVSGATDRHDAIQCLTGWPHNSMQAMGGRPSIGAVLARVHGPTDPSVPPFVGLAATTQHKPWSDAGQAGFLGPTFNAFKPDGPGLANLKLQHVTTDTLDDRKALKASFEGLKQDLEVYQGQDNLQAKALDVLTSSKLLDALDISKEPAKVRERYGDGKPYKFQFDGAPTVNDQLLVARRLVEAGVRCVTLSYGRWDSHGKNFDLVRDHGGKLDQCLSALIDDLEVRGMLNDVTVVVWGEFGRTPRINKDAGRDHWPQVAAALLVGGGMKTGQVIGSTNRLGEVANNRPVTHGEILATLYRNLGLDPTVTVNDPTGRPQHLVDAEPLREVH